MGTNRNQYNLLKAIVNPRLDKKMEIDVKQDKSENYSAAESILP